MQNRYGFSLKWERVVPELNLTAQFYTHDRTGAELLSLINDDANKTFGISFKTPPSDSTGVAHILEHSVLCGSRKYPSKEPFVELLKGSLQTFLNAMTFPDKTCYPVASQNLQDFYNLIDVYLDAVFHPRITRHIFQQEGWHYELERPEDPLRIKGVVYNEMKGAYSSPDSQLVEYSQQSLFPDTTYGLDSGGHPSVIPSLTYEDFKGFHRTLYHPSNARIFFSGDDPPQERLRLVQDFLREFDGLEVSSSVELQERFTDPISLERSYSATPGEPNRSMVTMNWLLDEAEDAESIIAFQILEEILIGMPASPLRKALIDSGLGEDLAGVGLEDDLRQMYFSTGLKGVEPGKEKAVEELLLRTLSDLATQGFDPRTVQAALNSVEFRYRENNSGAYPQGLILMLHSLVTWLHDRNPLCLLAFEEPLHIIKSRIESGERYFEHLVSKYLWDNPHRSTLVLKADPDLDDRREAEERLRLETVKAQMSREEIQAVVASTEELERLQSAPDRPEDLAAIPSLEVEDLDPRITTIPSTSTTLEGREVLCHDLPTNGIVYLDLGFDLCRLPQHMLGYVPIFGKVLEEMGTISQDFVSLSQRIARETGGIDTQTVTSVLADSARSGAWLFVRGKAVEEKAEELLNIFHDILTQTRLDDPERFLQLVLEEKAGLEQRLIPAGHQVVNARLRAPYNLADQAMEQMSGISQLYFLRELATRARESWPEVLKELKKVQSLVISLVNLQANVTAEDAAMRRLGPALADLLKSLPDARLARSTWHQEPYPDPEGLTLPSQVNYVGTALDLYKAGYSLHGSALVICRYLRTAFLWEKIRVVGGAYGAFSLFDRFSGIMTLLSYRDPNLIRTLKVFEDTADYLERLTPGPEELTRAIVGTVGDMDKYMLPDAKGFTACLRHLTGDSDDMRQRLRDEVLATTAEDFSRFASLIRKAGQDKRIAVLGSRSQIQEARDEGVDFAAVRSVM